MEETRIHAVLVLLQPNLMTIPATGQELDSPSRSVSDRVFVHVHTGLIPFITKEKKQNGPVKSLKCNTVAEGTVGKQ